ncbi:DUF7096 domain-containing protein [Haloterrigena gelatinilytica]|uniref:DUF7096 domain-containing protein n=1 Tax=Haloterrigena gelatinilytica TaxID=2741724 RepID=UPI001C2F0B1F|nr:hypothetical protein [Haloterrigena gelatinilytica]
MKSAPPVLLAVLLGVSLVAMPVIAAGPETTEPTQETISSASPQLLSHQSGTVDAENTTNRLPLTGDVTNEYTTYGSDIGLAFASVDDQLRVDHEQYTVIDSEFDDATLEERKNMVRAAYDCINNRTEAIEEREREAIRKHETGYMTDTELIRTLLRNQNEAERLLEALRELRDSRTEEIPGYSLSPQQVRADEASLELYQTSLRSELEQASQSSQQDAGTVVRIRTFADTETPTDSKDWHGGYSFSVIDGDTYVLETTRFDNRRADAVNQFEDYSNYETIQAATEFYPWAGEEKRWSEFNDYGEENLYFVNLEVDQTQLEVYLDGGTGQVYRERQELTLESLPKVDNETYANDSLNVSLTETPVNGPTKVAVTDAETKEPVTATVTVDGTEIGRTDDDGTLWILPPVDGYDLEVQSNAGSVDVTVSDD